MNPPAPVAEHRTLRVSVDEERSLIERVLLGIGANVDEACTVATVLVEADLRGQSSHGILRLPIIVERVRAGLIRPRATADLVWTSAASRWPSAAAGPHQVSRRAWPDQASPDSLHDDWQSQNAV